MKILVVVKNFASGVSYHRLITPYQLLEEHHDIEIIDNFKEKQINPNDYDLLIYNRSLGYGVQDVMMITQFKDAGCKILLDLDDYWELPEHHTIQWREDISYPDWRTNILVNLKLADYVSTSTEFLKSKIEEQTDKPVFLFRNAINLDEKQWKESVPRTNHKNKVVIGYAGSTTHYKDLDQIRPAIRAINKHKWLRDKIVWHLFGAELKSDFGKKVWTHQAQIFSEHGKYNNVWISTGVNVFQYAYFYDQMDISIAPVIDNEFNRAKSELKILEAGAKRVPFIGSNTLTYNRTNANVDLCSNTQEWIDSVKELVLDQNLRETLADGLHLYCKHNHSIKHENDNRLKVLKAIEEGG